MTNPNRDLVKRLCNQADNILENDVAVIEAGGQPNQWRSVECERICREAADRITQLETERDRYLRQYRRRDDALSFICAHPNGGHGRTVREAAREAMYDDPDIEWITIGEQPSS